MITQNLLAGSEEDTPQFTGEVAKKWGRARQKIKATQRLARATGPSKEEEEKSHKKRAQSAKQIKDRVGSRVQHLDPYRYVNRTARQLGISWPWQLPAEERLCAVEYLEGAKQKMKKAASTGGLDDFGLGLRMTPRATSGGVSTAGAAATSTPPSPTGEKVTVKL